MSDSARIPQVSRVRRIVAWTVLVLVALLVSAVIGDTAAASRAEHRLARALQSAPQISQEPQVNLSGFPFFRQAAAGEFSSIDIVAQAVGIGPCGTVIRGACTVDMSARLTDADVGSIWSVDGDTAITVSSLSAETRLDSVNLGRLMGITDMYISTPAPADKIGGGMPALIERTEGVMLSGTVPLPGSPERQGQYPPSAVDYTAPKVKVTVSASIELVDGRIRITADDFYDGPEEHFTADVPAELRSAVLKLFSTTLPALPLAWGTTATSAFARGSDLILTGTQSAATLRPRAY